MHTHKPHPPQTHTAFFLCWNWQTLVLTREILVDLILQYLTSSLFPCCMVLSVRDRGTAWKRNEGEQRLESERLVSKLHLAPLFPLLQDSQPLEVQTHSWYDLSFLNPFTDLVFSFSKTLPFAFHNLMHPRIHAGTQMHTGTHISRVSYLIL